MREVQCPSCGARYRLPTGTEATRFACSACETVFAHEAAAAGPAAAEVAPRSRGDEMLAQLARQSAGVALPFRTPATPGSAWPSPGQGAGREPRGLIAMAPPAAPPPGGAEAAATGPVAQDRARQLAEIRAMLAELKAATEAVESSAPQPAAPAATAPAPGHTGAPPTTSAMPGAVAPGWGAPETPPRQPTDDQPRGSTRDDPQRTATRDDAQRAATRDDAQRAATRDDAQRAAMRDTPAHDDQAREDADWPRGAPGDDPLKARLAEHTGQRGERATPPGGGAPYDRGPLMHKHKAKVRRRRPRNDADSGSWITLLLLLVLLGGVLGALYVFHTEIAAAAGQPGIERALLDYVAAVDALAATLGGWWAEIRTMAMGLVQGDAVGGLPGGVAAPTNPSAPVPAPSPAPAPAGGAGQLPALAPSPGAPPPGAPPAE